MPGFPAKRDMPGLKTLSEGLIRRLIKAHPEWGLRELAIHTGVSMARLERFMRAHHVPTPRGNPTASSGGARANPPDRPGLPVLPTTEEPSERWVEPLPTNVQMPAPYYRHLCDKYRELGARLPDRFARYGPVGVMMAAKEDRDRQAGEIERLRKELLARSDSTLGQRVAKLEPELAQARAGIQNLRISEQEHRRREELLTVERDKLGYYLSLEQGGLRLEIAENDRLRSETATQKREAAAQLASKDREIARLTQERNAAARDAAALKKELASAVQRVQALETDTDSFKARELAEARLKGMLEVAAPLGVRGIMTLESNKGEASPPKELAFPPTRADRLRAMSGPTTARPETTAN